MNNAMIWILAVSFVPQIICLAFCVLKPTKTRWVVTQLVQWVSLIGVLAMMIYVDGLCDQLIMNQSEYWPAYFYCFTAVCQFFVLMITTIILKSAIIECKAIKISLVKRLLDAVLGIIGGFVSFAITFLVIETYFGPSTQVMPVYICYTFKIIIPVMLIVSVMDLFGGITSGFVWFGLVVQYALLINFAEPMYAFLHNGADINASGFMGDNWLPYIGETYLFPLAVTLLQFLVLLTTNLIRYFRNRHR